MTTAHARAQLSAQQNEWPPNRSSTAGPRDRNIIDRIHALAPAAEPRTVLVVETVGNIVRGAGALFDALAGLLAPYGLSLAKYSLLAALRAAPNQRLRMADLGVEMSVSCPNITKLVDGLERDGLVRRGKLDGDRRVVLAELTPEGHALLERIVPELYAGAEAIMACLSSQECDEMIRLMLALRGGIQRSHHCRRADYTSGVRGAAPCRTDTASIDEQSGNSER